MRGNSINQGIPCVVGWLVGWLVGGFRPSARSHAGEAGICRQLAKRGIEMMDDFSCFLWISHSSGFLERERGTEREGFWIVNFSDESKNILKVQ